jgi:hypothetical protein
MMNGFFKGPVIQRLSLAAAAMLIGVAASPFSVWSGFRYPTETSWVRAQGSVACPAVGVQNLDAGQTRLLLAALTDVCGIYGDAEFARQVRAKGDWIMDCAPGRMAGQPITGDAVLAALTPPSRSFSVVARKPSGAVAVTNLHYQAIAIRKLRFEQWASPDKNRRAEMIETLAHEMTHLVPEPTRPKVSLFKDKGHVATPTRSDQCADARLVSYGVGKIVKSIWLARQP